MNNFAQAYGRFRKEGSAALPGRAVAALIYAVIAVLLTLVLPQHVNRIATLLPKMLFTGIAGTMYAYVMIAVFCLLGFRCFATKLSSYANVADGHCFFAVGCGANASTFLAAKYLSALLAPVGTYLLGAVLTYAGSILLGADASDSETAVKIAAAGLFMILCYMSLQLILGALGCTDALITAVSVAIFFFVFAIWYVKGFLSMGDPARVREAAGELTSVMGLLPALGLVAASAALCLTVPKNKVAQYTVEDLDDDMLRNLEFGVDLEVYEKQDDEFELLFAGKDVLNDDEK